MPKDDVLASIGQARGLPVMRNSDIRYTDTVPSAVGGITRFACEYAQERGIDVEALLQRSGLTAGQIEQPVYRARFFGHKFDLSGVLHVDFLPGETRLARAA
jgi:hypothetical protein